jgi:thiamine biosynthesis lipoprotein ApbE
METSAIVAAVMAPTALEADMWATALLAMGSQEGVELAQQRGLTAFLIER